tara:strand:+ start:283 stop:702 length:420 start_codon:yes stop_codon:yes gene_type:complete
MELKMNILELKNFLRVEFPQMAQEFEIVDINQNSVILSLKTENKHLRPGDTVSGPVIFTLCDIASYITLLAILGPVKQSVTTNCSIDFMRRPKAGILFCETKILKLGRRLAVLDGLVHSEKINNSPIARFSMTYALAMI